MGVLEDLKSKLKLGARANKYKVMLAAPQGPKDDALIDTICKGGSIPAKTIGVIPVWSQGRRLIIAGDSTFENTWSLTFYSTQDHKLQAEFGAWLDYVDNFEKHSRGADDHSYMTDGAKIQQLSTTDNSVTAEYSFHNMFPTGIQAMEMADETADTIVEFTVDFAYSHWVKTA